METHTSTLFVVLTTPFFDKEISWLGIFQSLKRVCISNYLQATEVPTSQLKLCFSKADQRPWSSRQRTAFGRPKSQMDGASQLISLQSLHKFASNQLVKTTVSYP
mmetsp:Transcript_87034/g.138053  ORF Transcript_87034/g.138053 Transcript_87034/m.138053 type:complete len:105 (-) Transcript_87034:581-895(-)